MTTHHAPDAPEVLPDPELSIVIPTYNRSALLDRTLRALADQRCASHRFEVIVSDDGSSDDTRQVVESYADELRITYHWQEDLGFRAAEARNAGAALASAPLLAFVDTGMLAGPDWVTAHLAGHAEQAGAGARILLGYTYGYNPDTPCPELLDLLDEGATPEEITKRLAELPSFADMREPDFARVGDEPARMAMPWVFLWTLNISLPTAEFRAIGGFDEDFRGWGVEDVELGYRLHERGLQMVVARDAWGIESPHKRETDANKESILRNCVRFLEKHPDLQPELYWAVSTRGLIEPLEVEWEEIQAIVRDVRDRDVRGEVEAGLDGLAAADPAAHGVRVLVLGSGGELPSVASRPDVHLTLCDFDPALLRRADEEADTSRVRTAPAFGMRTVFADQSFERVVVTSRLAGLWPAWGEYVLREAARVGREVRAPFLS